MPGLADIGTNVKTQSAKPAYWSGAAQSLLSSPLELFGVPAAPEVQDFRKAYPITGFGTEFLGTSMPYIGWGKAAKFIKPFEKIVSGIGDAEKAPILTRGFQEMARFAPFEAARAGIATAQGNDFGSELMQSGLNLGLAGVGGGVLGALEAAGNVTPRRPLADFAPTVDGDAPLQIRLRQLKTALEQGDVTDADAALNRYNSWLVDARRELPGSGQKHVGPLEGDDGADIARSLERNFFQPTDGGNLSVKQFTHGKGSFADQPSWVAAATEGRLPDEFPIHGQFFRYVSGATPAVERRLNAIAEKLPQVGEYRIAREQDGNFVMLRKVTSMTDHPKGYIPAMEGFLNRVIEGDQHVDSAFKSFMEYMDGTIDPAEAKSAFYAAAKDPVKVKSNWIAFKTDNPSAFSRTFRNWQKLDETWAAWVPPEAQDLTKAGEILRGAAKQKQMMPLVEYTELRKTGKIGKALEGFGGQLGENIQAFTEHYLTPTLNQFARHPLAQWIWQGSRDLFEAAHMKANDVMLGARNENSPVGVMTAVFFGGRPSGTGLQSIIQELNPEQIKTFWSLVSNVRPRKAELQVMFRNGQIDEQVYNAYNSVDDAVAKANQSLADTRKALGKKKKVDYVPGGLAPKWEGSLKQGLMNEGGDLIAVASANNMKALEKEMALIEEKLAVPGARRGQVWSGEDKAPSELKKFLAGETAGIRGYKWDFERFGTQNDLVKEYHYAIQSAYREEASESIYGLYNNELKRLQETQSGVWKQLDERIHALRGESGPVTQLINKIVDPVLSPILGKGSAGKIVDTTNRFFWHLQLGAFNIAHPVSNLVGVYQTVLPELAYVMHGAPERVGAYYTYQMLKGRRAVGIMSVLDPIKMMAIGTKEVFKPGAEALAARGRAISEGIIDPKFIEEFAGENAVHVKKLRATLADPREYPKALEALSAWGPSASERLARLTAFHTAYKTGADLLNLEGEGLYQFAKRFTERTMYNYSLADRSMILTSPAGRLFGSMKNWVFHYISNMMVYAGEAGRGNIAPLGWQMATTGLIGGIAATPLLGPIANGYSEAVNDQSLLGWLYGSVGQRAGDALYLGLPATLGVSFSSATSNPLRDANMLFSFAQAQRMDALSKAFGASIDQWQATGQHPASSELVRGAFARAFAPKALYRGLQVYDNPGIENLVSGYPIIDQVNPWNKVLFTAGFQPTEIERGYLAFDELMKDKSARQKKVAQYGTAMAQALRNNDSEMMDRVIRGAIVEGVDVSKIMHSAASRNDKDSKGMLERNFSQAQLNSLAPVIQHD